MKKAREANGKLIKGNGYWEVHEDTLQVLHQNVNEKTGLFY